MNNKSSFRFLWVGQSLANCGDVFYIVGLITLIYEVTGSATYMALFPLINTLSRFFSGIVAPLFLDRFSLKRLLVVSQMGKTIFLLLIGVVSTFMDVGSSILFILLTCVALVAFLDGWATPARNTLIPQLVPKDKLVKVNSFLSTIDEFIQLGAWPIGGILIVIMGSGNVISLTFVLFAIATILMGFIREPVNLIHQEEIKEDVEPLNRRDSLKEGWITIWKTPSLRAITIVECIESMANVVWIAAIMYVYVDQVLHANEQWWGYINTALSAGLMIGGFLGLKYDHMIETHLKFIIIASMFLVSLTNLAFGINSSTWLALFIPLLYGFLSVIKATAQQTIVQTAKISAKSLSKVYSAQDAIVFGTFGMSTLLLGYLTDIFGARFPFLLSAAFLLLAAIILVMNQHHLKINK
ncbi:MFS transporter [Priestia megaterium]|uniref:MFS transporter n=1 Tax=Priestia megaterium TaxID=1404 RepID=UPI003D039FE0